MNTKSTEALITEYDARIAGRFVKCELGSTRFLSRQRKIDAVVTELGDRADAGDALAAAWYEEA